VRNNGIDPDQQWIVPRGDQGPHLLRKKVGRIHIGTHGGDVHAALHRLFADDEWEVFFSYPPNAR
jgi:hypothetical protein